MTDSTPPSSPTLTAEHARRAVRNAGALAAATVFSRGLAFGWQILLSRSLGPETFGVFGAVSGFLLIASAITSFGMGAIYVRDVARHPERAGRYLTSTLFLQTLLGLAAYILVNAAAALGGYDLTVRVFLSLAALSLLIDVLGNMCFDLLLARERMALTSLVSVGHVVLQIALAGIGLALGYDLFGVYAGIILAGLARMAVLWGLVLRLETRPAFPFDRSVAFPLLLNGAPLALAGFLMLASQHADRLLTSRFVGKAETGYLAAATLVVGGLVDVLSQTILVAVYPLLARSYGDGKGDLFGMLVQKIGLFLLTVSLPLILALSVYAPTAAALFGPQFAPVADVLRVLAWYALLQMMNSTFSYGLTVANRQRTVLLIQGSGLAVYLGLMAVLLPQWGVLGAAWSKLLAEVLIVGLQVARFHAVGWNRARLLGQAARLGLLGAACGGVMLLLGPANPILGGAAGLGLYALGVARLPILRPDDWDFIYRLLGALPMGSLVQRVWGRPMPV